MDLLLTGAGHGDRAAFESVVERTVDQVFGLILQVVGDEVEAGEIARGVYLQGWQNASSYDPDRGSAAGWLLGIAHQKSVERVRGAARSRRRKSAFRRLRSDYRPEHDVARYPATPDHEGRRVRRALRCLPSLHREAIELAYFDGWTHTEVAAITGLAGGSAAAQIRDGLVRLRADLTDGAGA